MELDKWHFSIRKNNLPCIEPIAADLIIFNQN